MKNLFFFLTFVIELFFSATVDAQSPKIEYIAHASFVLESSEGTRVVIDPYHSYRQMGFTFPENITADFILITHPHYDHDGSQYFSKNIPVFRDAGRYHYNDISFYGIASKHSFAEQIGKSGNQNYNTIWVVEMDGVRIAHLGDNEVPTEEEIKLLEEVDYIIGHPQDAYLSLFTDKIYIPNHYLLPEVSKHTNWMQPVTDWLKNKQGVHKLESNTYKPVTEDTTAQILVFEPSPLVQEWSQEYYNALEAIKKGNETYKKTKNLEKSIAYMDQAIETAPYVMDGYYNKALLLKLKKDHNSLITVLKSGFSAVPDIDWGFEAKTRLLLAQSYIQIGKAEFALNNYLWLQRHHRIVNRNDLKEAKEFIDAFKVKKE